MTKFMLLQYYAPTQGTDLPMSEWSPQDIQAHITFQIELNRQLAEAGELVDAQGLATPDVAKFVTDDGAGSAVVTDGVFPEAKELIAGYRLIDVDSEARAVEIAALASAAPGPDGAPIRQTIEVRQVMGTPGGDE